MSVDQEVVMSMLNGFGVTIYKQTVKEAAKEADRDKRRSLQSFV